MKNNVDIAALSVENYPLDNGFQEMIFAFLRYGRTFQRWKYRDKPAYNHGSVFFCIGSDHNYL